MKRIVSILVSICILFGCFAVYASAADSPVVNVYLCARSTASPFGHLWLYFENLTNHDVMVGAYTLKAGQGVSVGSFGSKGKDGPGVYYNVEAYSVTHYGISGIISIKDTLTAAELDKVSYEIKDTNMWEPFIMNCMGFAFHIWNINSSPKLLSFIFPAIGRLLMLTMYDTSRDLKMYKPDASQVCYQIGNTCVMLTASSKMLKKIM